MTGLSWARGQIFFTLTPLVDVCQKFRQDIKYNGDWIGRSGSSRFCKQKGDISQHLMLALGASVERSEETSL